MTPALFSAVLIAAPPTPTERPPMPVTAARPPPKWADGSWLMGMGSTISIITTAGGIWAVAGLGGSATTLALTIVTPVSASGGGLLVTGASLRGRHRGWYDPLDMTRNARLAQRAGWPLLGVGTGFTIGGGIALLTWPYEPGGFEFAAARYPGAFVLVSSLVVLGPLLVSGGATAVAWGASYLPARRHQFKLRPTASGLVVRF